MIHKISRLTLINEIYRQVKGIIAYSIFFKILSILFRSVSWNCYFNTLVAISIILSIFTLINQLLFFFWEFDGENLIVNSGIFFKKRVVLSKGNIKGVQMVTPWYFKPFKLYSLKIKLPSVGDSESIKFPVINETELMVFQTWYGDEETESIKEIGKNLVNINISRLIVSSIFTLNYLYLLTILDFLDKGLKYINISLFNILFSHYRNILFLCLIAFCGILSSFIKQFLDYYYLEVYIDNHNINVRNGLLSSEYIKINLNDVIGFKISQNIGQKLLGLWSLKVIVINYNITGGVSKVTHILPFSTIKEIKQFEYEIYGINTFIIEENINQSYHNIQNIALLILCIASGLSSTYWLMLVIFIFINLKILWNRKYKIDGTNLILRSSFIANSSTIIEKNNIEWKEVISLFSKVNYLRIAYTYNPLKVFRCLEMRK
ncbi:PH domain-containing protein [Lactococcus lactis]|uniref:PH domain-containing protein n=1 Tax=Lactococcus lactis TaxID=1358 RepID=UPI002074A0F8|nr:PH domain-containing protein [Lactococcus lactis]MCM6841519.1 PH domain-containing protein [Lactococcus lactis]MCM6849561.1 PH domain-containing protein [Lactococcus lactis]MCM6851689.1 PH domain-containing protein [Lactococcus lactis]MCM6859423.1 PH domain-containing protein [Lactococcus lactis]